MSTRTDKPSKAARRKSRSGSETRRRTRLVHVRFTPNEYDLLQRAAVQTQDTISNYVRRVVRGKPASGRGTPGEVRLSALYLGQLGKIGSNLNQIARAVNMGLAGQDVIAETLREAMDFRELLGKIIRKGTD
jgi:hypothetical protein